jgi:CopG family transcriptional regulator/antitoxin EndoAI
MNGIEVLAIHPYVMSRRINIILPDKTLAVLDRVTTKGNRSRFIDRAVRRLVEAEGKMNLRARLKEEAIANAERDLAIAAEWFPLEEEAGRLADSGGPRKRSRRRT